MAINLNKGNNKKILKMLIAIIIIFFLIYIIYNVAKLVIKPTNIFVVENGVISEEQSAIGYIIREEAVIQSTDNNDIVQIKVEGEKVAKGEAIFRYYNNNEETIKGEIEELNLQIQEALDEQTNLFTSDIKALEKQIENKTDGLELKNNIQEIIEYKKDINTYITKKAKIAGDLSEAGSYINNLINERNNYENQLKTGFNYVEAPIGGVASYRIDNLESILIPEDFSKLSKKFLEDLNLKTGQIISTSNKTGKVINNFECYIATYIDSDEAKEAVIGRKITVRLSTQDEIDGTIEYIKQEEKETLIVIKINNCVERLIDYRKISFDIIWWKYKGLKIPNTALIYDNGLSYVVRNRAGYLDKILVKILKENKKYCIVENYTSEELQNLGYTPTEINNSKKISLYDEILTEPEVEQ